MLYGEFMLNSEVAEVEEDIAHTGVFPIQDADAGAVINKIAVEQVIVARTESQRFTCIHGGFDLT